MHWAAGWGVGAGGGGKAGRWPWPRLPLSRCRCLSVAAAAPRPPDGEAQAGSNPGRQHGVNTANQDGGCQSETGAWARVHYCAPPFTLPHPRIPIPIHISP
eukprot:scaffold2475_cov115-Isochrysis_galbana.AAC.12